MRKFLKIVGFVFLGIIVLAVIVAIVSPEGDDTASTNGERSAVMDTHSQRKREGA